MRVHRFLLAFVLTAVFAMTGCAAPPPVSEKVQRYYDKNVARQADATATATSTPVAPPAPAKKAVFIGDSYAQGDGASAPANKWTAKLSLEQGWAEHNIARGGTGYLATPANPKAACGLEYCPTHGEMIPDAVKAQPEIVIVFGGSNDVWFKSAAFKSAVDGFYRELRGALPNARIVAVSPVWDASKPPSQLAAYGDAIRAAVTAARGEFVDVKQPLEGHPNWTTADGVDLEDAGHAAVYLALKAALPAK